MRGAGRWRLYGPLTCMGALRSDERASAIRTEALYGVGASAAAELAAASHLHGFGCMTAICMESAVESRLLRIWV